ncbi:MAG: hypothetical protein KKI02_10260 [Planctomycetes bacterium]|nr:hypothetical protein [Planctomycetota bacterium]
MVVTPEPDLDRIRCAWQNATPGDVVRALNQIAEYAPTAAAVIREEAKRRGLTSDSSEAFPAPAYAPIRTLATGAGERLARVWRPLRKLIERHPYISAAGLGVVYYLAASNLSFRSWVAYLWLALYFVGLVVICLPLRRYRLTILVPVTAGAVASATLCIITLPGIIAGPRPSFPWMPIATALLIGFAACSILPALLLTGTAFIRNRYWPVHEPGHCRVCDYDLRGLPEPRCPECGTPFDPAEAPALAQDGHTVD